LWYIVNPVLLYKTLDLLTYLGTAFILSPFWCYADLLWWATTLFVYGEILWECVIKSMCLVPQWLFGENNHLYMAEYRCIMHWNCFAYYDFLVYMYNMYPD